MPDKTHWDKLDRKFGVSYTAPAQIETLPPDLKAVALWAKKYGGWIKRDAPMWTNGVESRGWIVQFGSGVYNQMQWEAQELIPSAAPTGNYTQIWLRPETDEDREWNEARGT